MTQRRSAVVQKHERPHVHAGTLSPDISLTVLDGAEEVVRPVVRPDLPVSFVTLGNFLSGTVPRVAPATHDGDLQETRQRKR